MSINSQVVNAILWLSTFKIVSQLFSWSVTIIIARILTAEDYGIMEIATVFTGYIEFFVEFGISAAIINKTELIKDELNSIFWFLIFWGMLLGASCLVIAPITSWFYNNKEIIPITSTVGILFIISSTIILPRSLLHRELRFKEVGAIDAASIFIACITMFILAKNNAGYWTLLFGTISREAARLIMLYIVTDFRPNFHFRFREIKPILKFGLPVLASNSLFYIYNKSDRFFGGRSLGKQQIGYYSIALQLAAMPVEKILSLFQSAIFPAFSKLKEQKDEFNKLFLDFSQVAYSIILPLFLGGFFIAELAIPMLLGKEWIPSAVPFKYLVISQMFISICAPLNTIHVARGKPDITFKANSILCPIMFTSFYFSSKLGSPSLLAIPWITVYPVFVLLYMLFTIKALNIKMADYLAAIKHPVLATTAMALTILFYKKYFLIEGQDTLNLSIIIITGASIYISYIYAFSKNIFNKLNFRQS